MDLLRGLGDGQEEKQDEVFHWGREIDDMVTSLVWGNGLGYRRTNGDFVSLLLRIGCTCVRRLI